MSNFSPTDSEALRGRLGKVASSSVSDAQASLGTILEGIKSIVPGLRAIGPAFTAKCYPGSIITVHKALCEARPGDVLVVDGGGDYSSALFGELMALQAQVIGLAGLVVDGAVRDVAGIRALGFPVFSKVTTARVGTNRRIGQTQVGVSCGGVPVSPGDWIIADDDSVSIIPAAALLEVVAAAEQVEAREVTYAERIRKGEHVADIIGVRDLIYSNHTK